MSEGIVGYVLREVYGYLPNTPHEVHDIIPGKGEDSRTGT